MKHPIVDSLQGVTLVGGGPVSAIALAKARALAPGIVGADSGADRLLRLGVTPEAVIGDMDSLSAVARARLADRLFPIAEQDTTDFDKALRLIAAPFVLGLGFAGARADHGLAVLNTLARHPDRPHATDYIGALIQDFTPLAGDRAFADDAAVVGGMGRFRGRAVMVLGTERGHDTESRVKHNFGMARPEGYRKARRLMELAGRFGMPILSFVDTSGAFPGIDAEARGQAEAIARSIEAGLDAPVDRDHHW
jgi:hypothetical protein